MELEDLLHQYNNGNISINDVKRRIACSYICNVGNNIAKLDINRKYRKGIPEVIYAANKDYIDIEKIILNLLKRNFKTKIYIFQTLKNFCLQDVCRTNALTK